ncbi:MAG: hypothetical protein FJ028_00160 [Chloroflexi bacterium]|nr:hypothetical protein [Chloroflexota bacterium]
MLSDGCARPVRVDNAGVSAWEPDHHLFEARRALERERYDMGIVFILMANDVFAERRAAFSSAILEPARVRRPRSFDRTEIVLAVLEPINDELNARSHLWLLEKSRTQGLLTTLGPSRISLPEV